MTYRTGLTRFDAEKHARFRSAAEYGFTFQTPSYPVDKTFGIADWGMEGNGPDPTLTLNNGQPVGDCGPSAVPAHAAIIANQLVGGLPGFTRMTADQVVSLYFEFTGGQDTGVDLGDWLLWLFQKGLIAGFVKIDVAELESALATFDVVVTGVDLIGTEPQGVVPWDVPPGASPNPNEGHAILFGRATSESGPFGWISWGQVIESTLAWRQQCPQQAFAVLMDAEITAKGWAQQAAAIVADLKALGGTVYVAPAPDPQPTPSPTPAPSPTPSDDRFLHDLRDACLDVVRVIEEHLGL